QSPPLVELLLLISLIVDGHHKILFSGSIHYPRSTPEMWPSLIAKAKAGGIDVIQTYYDFSGRGDIVRFIKEVQAQGLYVCLRLGPFIQSEWTYGGFPIWLRDVPGIVFRTDNEPFKIVGMLKAEKLYASQGGPIILSQIENEYGTIEAAFHEKGPAYVRWAAKMAVKLQTGVPWVMCKQNDAPDPVINTCNGMKCGETFAGPNSPNKPALWTENWTTRYEVYGEDTRPRSAEDIAFHVALFIAKKKGSYYHGGTNFGRTASEYVLTSYYDKAPLDEYGFLRQPNWGHLKELHAAIKLCTKPLLSGAYTNISLGHQQELPPKSISILPDCKTVAFNSAKITAQYGTRSMETSQKLDSTHQWEEYREAAPSFGETSMRANMLLEQMDTTKDVSDYLWYSSSPANKSFALNKAIPLKKGRNDVSLLSVMSGLPDGGAYLERRVAGLRRVRILDEYKVIDLTDKSWGYQIGTLGETKQVYTADGASKTEWRRYRRIRHQPLTWYKTSFDAPDGDDPVALNLGSMGKGEAWVNGKSIGRYWVSFLTPSGKSSQTWQVSLRVICSFFLNSSLYNVPRSFLNATGNLLVIFEEEKGHPLGISVDTVSITKVCGLVSDLHPPPVISWRRQDQIHTDDDRKPGRRPKVQLQCPPGKKISRILFSSYGNPSGDCQSYAIGSCHLPNSSAIVEKVCVGKNKCTIPVWKKQFGGDPCPGVSKSLLLGIIDDDRWKIICRWCNQKPVSHRKSSYSWLAVAFIGMLQVECVLCWLVLLLSTAISTIHGGSVTYDGRSLIINGEHKILFSGSIHYPRSTPDMWPSLISKAKDGGIDVIQTYVFWNQHEPQQGQYDFSGRNDLVKFLKEIQAQGLYACLRIGPFIESEWAYGGLPFWLHDIPGIVFRSDNEPFKYYMQKFVSQIVSMMKSKNLYASQGGPIILSQIENEYKNVESAFHDKGPSYVRWAAAMAVSLQTGVPWEMCKQDDAPDPVINACNGMRCGETFAGPNSPNKPSIWTENWTSFYQVYGGETYIRSAEDIAFHVALFIAKKGSYVNYYMYHGGTNFGRTGAAFIITSYYDQAPLDEFGLIRQPKWGHLKELHAAIKSCAKSLLNGAQQIFPLGQMQQAYVFKGTSGDCAAFLVNNDATRNANVIFQNISYTLPKKSISILPDCKTIRFNTAKVNTQYTTRSMTLSQMFNSGKKWEEYKEPIPAFNQTPLRAKTLLEHMSTTKDTSDYLWYTFRLQQEFPNSQPILHAESRGHVGLSGEKLQVYTQSGLSKVKWNKFGTSLHQPLMWYKTFFDAPAGNDPVALQLGSMGKGEAWVNGQSIGRYWVSFHTSKGKPSQLWYNIPRSFLKPTQNLLVLLEEEKGYPNGITIGTASITQLPSKQEHLQDPICKLWYAFSCHSPKSEHIIQQACVGKRNCSISHSNKAFGGDPCPGIPK
ncbi:hypothetical protein Tsubulata_043380, partial [Turnera subulata]